MKNRLSLYRDQLTPKTPSLPRSKGTMLRIKYVAIGLGTLLFLVVLVGWYFLLGPSSSHSGDYFDSRNNAVWAQHAWSEKPHSPAEIQRFVETLGAHHIKYVYLHVGPLDSDGSIPPQRYAALADFLGTARMFSDRIVYIPWIGQMRSKLPLERPSVRQNIVDTVKIFTRDFDMGGVHFDIEPIVDNDSDFLFLLEDARRAIGSEKIISVALPEYVPEFIVSLARNFMHLNTFLSEDYLSKIDMRIDQLVVMTYENSFRDGRVYQYFVKNEIIWLTNALKHAKLLVGLPTYDAPSETFHPEAENIEFGLRGVIDGLNNWRSNNTVFDGVALYGYWTTDSKEWKTMDTLFHAANDR